MQLCLPRRCRFLFQAWRSFCACRGAARWGCRGRLSAPRPRTLFPKHACARTGQRRSTAPAHGASGGSCSAQWLRLSVSHPLLHYTMHTRQGKVRLGNDSGAKLWYYGGGNSSQKLSPRAGKVAANVMSSRKGNIKKQQSCFTVPPQSVSLSLTDSSTASGGAFWRKQYVYRPHTPPLSRIVLGKNANGGRRI